MPLATTLVASHPRGLHAQYWPEASIQAGIGISSLSGTGPLGALISASRTWGPITRANGAEMRIANRNGGKNNSPTCDPIGGGFECGGQPVNSITESCMADLPAQGGPTAELGVALAPSLPFLLTVGYRLSPASEVFYSGTIFGSTSRDGMGWTLRVAAGKKVTLLRFGMLFDLPQQA